MSIGDPLELYKTGHLSTYSLPDTDTDSFSPDSYEYILTFDQLLFATITGCSMNFFPYLVFPILGLDQKFN